MVTTADDQGPCQAPEQAPAPLTRTWHLRVAYDGTAFDGWQIQPERRTVQGELQERIRRLFRAPDLRLSGTSRTDAGVHALDQHVSFVAPPVADLDGDRLRYALNRWLPADVEVLAAREEAPGFNARFANCGKAYTYCLFHGHKVNPLFARFIWPLRQRLDLDAMRRAAGLMEGERDFASFGANPKREIASTVCRLLRVEAIAAADLVCVSVIGNRFLYKMVRSLVGYLVHVGHHRAPPEALAEVLAARDRCAAAQSAPAAGLFLARVFFSGAEMASYRPQVPPFAWPGSSNGAPDPQPLTGRDCGGERNGVPGTDGR